MERTVHPHILLTTEKLDGLRSLDEVRAGTREGHGAQLWAEALAGAQTDLRAAPLLPSSIFPGRDPLQARHANRDYTICRAVQLRLHRDAIAALLTGDARFAEAALRQMEALFDTELWPEWRDMAHQVQGLPADLRTGMFAKSVALAYDWLHPMLTGQQRERILQGIERCAIRPFLRSAEAGAWWFRGTTNWTTCVTGGLGIAGMALGDDHPEARRLVELSMPVMRDYLKVLGPEGEFNESVAYSTSMEAPVTYWMAHRCHTGGGDDMLRQPVFSKFARWHMHFVVPPGCMVPFGDAHPGAPPIVGMFAALAAATRDGVLQWFYLNHCAPSERRDPVMEMLWFDPTVEPVSPEGRMPRGRAYAAHGACVSSRTDWDPRSTPCVVYSKGGHGAEAHGNHDAGQVCIEAHGEPLIVDLGAPSIYPADFFGPNRWRYYNAGACGHNVLLFGGREMRSGPEDKARMLEAAFDERKGGWWTLDLAGVYEGVLSARRTVVHLLPGVVVVLDDARLRQCDDISLRWHTADRCEPDAQGNFTVRAARASLSARILTLDAGTVAFSREEHLYAPPFDKDRMGEPLEHRRESFVRAQLTGSACRLLSLFAVFGPGQAPQPWKHGPGAWSVETPDGRVEVTAGDTMLRVHNAASGHGWRVDLCPPSAFPP